MSGVYGRARQRRDREEGKEGKETSSRDEPSPSQGSQILDLFLFFQKKKSFYLFISLFIYLQTFNVNFLRLNSADSRPKPASPWAWAWVWVWAPLLPAPAHIVTRLWPPHQLEGQLVSLFPQLALLCLFYSSFFLPSTKLPPVHLMELPDLFL